LDYYNFSCTSSRWKWAALSMLLWRTSTYHTSGNTAQSGDPCPVMDYHNIH